jgi:hypothetical protein
MPEDLRGFARLGKLLGQDEFQFIANQAAVDAAMDALMKDVSAGMSSLHLRQAETAVGTAIDRKFDLVPDDPDLPRFTEGDSFDIL